MPATPPFRRNPLVISGNSLSSGDRTTTFATGNPDALLRSYLIFVRDLRGQRREPSIELRTEDVDVIATHLGVSAETVLGGLLELMGTTRAQRATMLAMLAAGALTVVLSGSIVTSLSTDGMSVEMGRLAEAVQAAVDEADKAAGPSSEVAPAEPGSVASRWPASDSPSAVGTAPLTGATDTEAGSGETTRTDGDATAGPSLVEQSVTTPRPDVLRSAAASSAAPAPADGVEEPAGETAGTPEARGVAQEPVRIAIAWDGSLVASVAPPVPAATADQPAATAQLADGTTVGVGAPPVPAPPADEQVATAELADGTTVGVAAPPVPPQD